MLFHLLTSMESFLVSGLGGSWRERSVPDNLETRQVNDGGIRRVLKLVGFKWACVMQASALKISTHRNLVRREG